MSGETRGHTESYAEGDRLSLKGQSCTVRYVGPVADKAGTWLGVEWDDPARGKHNGTHNGRAYFTCRSASRTCASFLKPTQSFDTPRTFLQALQEKYMPDFNEGDSGKVYFSGKEAEEIGFEKFHQRQAQLRGIRVLILDHAQIDRAVSGTRSVRTITDVCSEITELDMSANLFASFDKIAEIISCMPKLKTLNLGDNRFRLGDRAWRFDSISRLSLSATLLHDKTVAKLTQDVFPSLTELDLSRNELTNASGLVISSTIRSIDLSANEFGSFAALSGLWQVTGNLDRLVLKSNKIAVVNSDPVQTFNCPVKDLDLAYNMIADFAFFDSITPYSFPNLTHLRVTGNPIYQSLVSAEGKPLTAADGYMLTIARLPHLQFLNYSKVTDKERLNAETYYLGQIAIETSQASPSERADMMKRHPRYKDLCEEYGEPQLTLPVAKEAVNVNSLAARLITMTFTLSAGTLPTTQPRSWEEEVPKTFSAYAVHGLVGKRLKRKPLDIRLILETSEQDPVGQRNAYNGPEWWDSSEDEDEDDGLNQWVKREVELVPGTRPLATYVEGSEAFVRVQRRNA